MRILLFYGASSVQLHVSFTCNGVLQCYVHGMIVMRMRGGLGNQLFQYACGRAAALRLGTELALDLRDWARSQPFPFYLSHFTGAAKTVPPERLPPGRGMGAAEFLRAVFGPKLRTYREALPGYDAGIESVADGTLLKGYWQSERYFADYKAAIRADLRFAAPSTGETARLIEEIGDCQAVSLHIRRGDYVSNAKFNSLMGVTGLEYYKTAADLIAEQMMEAPVFYAFSDDPVWVQENLSLPFEVRLVNHNDSGTAHEDLRLMSACRHHVIANSTFSWWGAWLNPSERKLVAAPKQWYADSVAESPDITPDSWYRI